ncbi:MAG: hypothetical protein IM553_10900 [Microcystis sp. M57BS1]|uniref:hypothetical protein n=1 Tax=unclassified Microcystis TaxID=2643300 RepID=UPI00258493AC|nr:MULTISPECIES: hypothetical protein [unclassified Microcystis]MCA2549019.1 hypothetical protein [Microcystis sp. M53BS1]MCA2609100.1 hypothetical protein [Microcystis sp. M27BS1]MCA2528850.1 hypothetical protein [Microcystis sp. M51BS1]MCA2534913.1 hypothetical protein [Microcystis sp. M57BS1]MCA2546800.1 hypothetical protein [Microcystis sp. M55BS1]
MFFVLYKQSTHLFQKTYHSWEKFFLGKWGGGGMGEWGNGVMGEWGGGVMG